MLTSKRSHSTAPLLKPPPLHAVAPPHSAIDTPGNTASLPSSELARATVLSHLVPVEDMQDILSHSQRLLSKLQRALGDAIRDIPDLLALGPTVDAIDQQVQRNARAIISVEKDPQVATLGDIIALQIAIEESQSLVVNTLLHNRSRIVSDLISDRLAPGPEFQSIAAIRGTSQRAEHLLGMIAPSEPTVAQHECLSTSLGILVAALTEGLPQAQGWGRKAEFNRAYATTNALLETYQPSEALQALFRQTFEYVYGESGLAETIDLIEHFWDTFQQREKTAIANYYAQALWHSFNREIDRAVDRQAPLEPHIPVVFDNTLSPIFQIDSDDPTGAFFSSSRSSCTPGAIVINHRIDTTHSALEVLSFIGHEMVHACIFHLIREGITPHGCERDLPWLKASTTLNAVSGMYDRNPHEQIARFGQHLLTSFFEERAQSHIGLWTTPTKV